MPETVEVYHPVEFIPLFNSGKLQVSVEGFQERGIRGRDNHHLILGLRVMVFVFPFLEQLFHIP